MYEPSGRGGETQFEITAVVCETGIFNSSECTSEVLNSVGGGLVEKILVYL
jgi:hypothetical protein